MQTRVWRSRILDKAVVGEMRDFPELKEHISPVVSRNRAVLAVYLFGSQAEGSATAGSDMDLAVLVEEVAGSFRLGDLVELELELGSALGNHHLDVVLLNHAPLPLQHRVLATAKLLYSRNDVGRTDYEERVVKEYIDFQPRLDALQREYLRALHDKYAQPGVDDNVSVGKGGTAC